MAAPWTNPTVTAGRENDVRRRIRAFIGHSWPKREGRVKPAFQTTHPTRESGPLDLSPFFVPWLIYDDRTRFANSLSPPLSGWVSS